MMTVPISTVNITGLRIMVLGFSFMNDSLSAVCTKAGSNNLFDLLFMVLYYLSIEKYSAIGPKASEGKYDNALSTIITAKVIAPKVIVSVFCVPADSGINFFWASKPAIATGPMMGRNLPSIITRPVVTFQNILPSPRPSNPEPLLALDE